MRRLAVHSFTLIESILYFLQTFDAPNIPLDEFPSSAPGLTDFNLSMKKKNNIIFILKKKIIHNLTYNWCYLICTSSQQWRNFSRISNCWMRPK